MGKTKILIVDDDMDAIDTLESLLEYKGYEVIACNDGASALRKVKEERPEVVILDIMMPGMDGYNVCETIKTDSLTRDTIVIMLTAKDMFGDVEKALDKKADWYIVKPYDNKYVIDKIEFFLKKKREKK
jgi:two-component system, OmpR family, alkaline phosphatase synthesis response regulator PhoP